MSEVQVDVIKINTSQAEQSMGNLKKEMKDTRQQMIELRMRGEETSEAYKQLAARAGDLQKAMARANEDIKEASTTFTNTVSYVSGSLAGVSGAVQAATGALSLMGVEMGNDTKLMKTLVAAMSITSGLTAIQGSVEAFKKLTTNIKRSTLAQQGLNAAIKANPWGAALTAILAVTAALGAFAVASKNAAKESQKAMEEAAKKTEEAWKARLENIKKLMGELANTSSTGADYWNYEEFNKAKDEYIKSLEDAGVSLGEAYREIEKQQRAYRKAMADPNWMKNNADEYKNFIENQRRLIYLISADNDTITAEMQDSWGNTIKAEQQYEQEMAKIAAADKENARKIQESNKAKADAQREADLKRIQSIIDSTKTELQKLEEKYNEEKALLEKYGEDTTKLTEKYNSDRANIIKKQDDAKEAERVTKAEQSIYNHELQLQDEYYRKKWAIVESGEKDIDSKLQQLELQQLDNEAIILADKHANRLISEEEFQNELLRIGSEKAQRRIEIQKEEAEKKKAIDAAYMNSAVTIANSLGGVLGSMSEILGEDTEEMKNIKAAQAIINTIAGAVAAFMGITESTGGWGIAAAAAQAAAVLAAGFAEVKKIYAVDTSGGKNNTTTSSAAVSTLSTNYNNTRLVDNGGGVYDLTKLASQNQNQKVYVLTHDIQEGLDKVNVTTRRNMY